MTVRTREEWTLLIVDDLRDLWRHMDEHSSSAPKSAMHAAGMARAGARMLAEGREEATLGDLMAQAVLLLTLVREMIIENNQQEKRPPS